MPIRRPRSPKPALRHLAFLDGMVGADGPAFRSARAALLTLRLLDHWMMLGAAMAEPDSSALRETRAAVDATAADALASHASTGDTEMRDALGGIIDAIVALGAPDAQPVLPRLHALGVLLEHRGLPAQAADVFQTTSRLVDAAVQLDLAQESLVHQAQCLRQTGDHEWAEQALTKAGVLANRGVGRTRRAHRTLALA